jgi:hypothetical protein
MARHLYIVTGSTKDLKGNITGICGDGWRHAAATAIGHIRGGSYEYRVLTPEGPHVRPFEDCYLRSGQDGEANANLRDLPDC